MDGGGRGGVYKESKSKKKKKKKKRKKLSGPGGRGLE